MTHNISTNVGDKIVDKVLNQYFHRQNRLKLCENYEFQNFCENWEIKFSEYFFADVLLRHVQVYF